MTLKKTYKDVNTEFCKEKKMNKPINRQSNNAFTMTQAVG